jgi:hypothetical protein
MSIFRQQIALESGAPAARVVPEEMRRCKRLAKLAAPWQIRNGCIDVLEVPSIQGGAPLVIIWFINPINYSYITYKP